MQVGMFIIFIRKRKLAHLIKKMLFLIILSDVKRYVHKNVEQTLDQSIQIKNVK